MSKAQEVYDGIGNEIFAATVERLRDNAANTVVVSDERLTTCRFHDGSHLLFIDGFAHVQSKVNPLLGNATAKNGWELLTPEALERIRKTGYGEGGTLWLCVPSKHGKVPDVVQGDYSGMAFYPGTQAMRDAFKTDLGQYISVCDVSHTMSFQPPAPPELD